MRQKTSRAQAFLNTILIGLVITGTVLFIWSNVTISIHDYPYIVIVMFSFCIILIMMITYQSFHIEESAEHIAEDISTRTFLYSHELFIELYRSSPVPYILIHETGIVESINLATARLFQTDINGLTGKNAFSFFKNDDAKTTLIPEYFTHGKFVNDIELQIVISANETRWVLLSLFSFQDSKKARKGLLTLVDITKQKQIDIAKTEFVSLASHQLRTPLSGMKWNIELLQSTHAENLSETQVAYIDKIARGLERMNALVTDFLSASKFELGTLIPKYTDFDITQFLKNIYTEHELFARKKNITIITDWTHAQGDIHTDEHLLHMITNNLLSNAVKYTPEQGTVHFSSEIKEGKLTIVVKDTGMGIPRDEQDMIFSKMFRADNARSHVPDGTGLGLYIVHEAVHILRGTITFESKEGEGTTFTVLLPVQ